MDTKRHMPCGCKALYAMRCNDAANTGPNSVGAGQPKKQSGTHNDARPCFYLTAMWQFLLKHAKTTQEHSLMWQLSQHMATARRRRAGAAVGEMTSDRCPYRHLPGCRWREHKKQCFLPQLAKQAAQLDDAGAGIAYRHFHTVAVNGNCC